VTRLLIVSNRLPVHAVIGDGEPRVEASSGGLATGLRTPHERLGGVWIGWPGDLSELDDGARARIDRSLAEQRLAPIHLTPDEVKRYYEGFSNGILWPLFHYLTYALPLEGGDSDAYRAANQRFADAVAEHWRPGDVVWVHDYQLLLVPQLVRRRCPRARIGFFLHIPFPSSELFRMLPAREELLRGMLGADLIGFHTASYLRHFASTVQRILGVPTEIDRLVWEGREVRLGVFPMGVDARELADTASAAAVAEEARDLRAGDTRILLGVDRLDYTKGIPRRLLAFERLLERHPEWRERVRLVQVAVPSREDVDAYQSYRSQADELIGRIHGAFATARWVPVHWMYRGLSREDVVALYRAADIMLVTPIRDGMNLVAKEFVASRSDGDGVLVLSEFAGAAAELAEALHVNPFDVEATAETYHRALTMPENERRQRMAGLRRRVESHDVHHWVASFLATLESVGKGSQPPSASGPSDASQIERLAATLRAAPHAVLLLDYDGTLVPLERTPELAAPDAALRELLRALAARPGFDVHVLSGRTAEVLENWLGDLPVGLHGEHGLWSREPDGHWHCEAPPTEAWLERVLVLLEDFRARTPGALIERKTASLAWHWRAADPAFGDFQARDLQLHLTELLSNLPVEILLGDKVIEVRPHGIDKSRIVAALLARAAPDIRWLALGDDRTDEDTFAALPEDGIAIHVGPSASRAPYRLRDVAAVRGFLRSLIEAPERSGSA
jgi:trehalose 6-phosphate synthase/phosphatase